MGKAPDDDHARYVIKYKATKTWFNPVPTSTTQVRGDKAKRTTTAAIREAGGQVVKVRKVNWMGF